MAVRLCWMRRPGLRQRRCPDIAGTRPFSRHQPVFLALKHVKPGPSKMDDKTYQKYVRMRLPENTPSSRTGEWISGLGGFHANPARTIKDALAGLDDLSKPNTSLKTALARLEDFLVCVHRTHRDKETAKQVIASRNVGQRALLWFLRPGAFDYHDLLMRPNLATAVAHCLAAEESEEYMWNLIPPKPIPLLDILSAAHAGDRMPCEVLW